MSRIIVPWHAGLYGRGPQPRSHDDDEDGEDGEGEDE